MREIKFRVWDGQSMEQIRPLWFEELGCYHDDCFSKSAKEINCTLMQYTGLKDKNGKEIYEGDIIQAPTMWHQSDLWVICWDDHHAKFTSVNKMGFPEIAQTQELSTHGCTKFAEVIGNIHENPELLEVKDEQ